MKLWPSHLRLLALLVEHGPSPAFAICEAPSSAAAGRQLRAMAVAGLVVKARTAGGAVNWYITPDGRDRLAAATGVSPCNPSTQPEEAT